MHQDAVVSLYYARQIIISHNHDWLANGRPSELVHRGITHLLLPFCWTCKCSGAGSLSRVKGGIIGKELATPPPSPLSPLPPRAVLSLLCLGKAARVGTTPPKEEGTFPLSPYACSKAVSDDCSAATRLEGEARRARRRAHRGPRGPTNRRTAAPTKVRRVSLDKQRRAWRGVAAWRRTRQPVGRVPKTAAQK